ncbi:MAG: hypothetical protein ACRDG2_07060, partial [Actinomycetota bacterium]
MWSAAGTPDAVFRTDPGELERVTGAEVADFKEGAGEADLLCVRAGRLLEMTPPTEARPTMIQLTENAAGKVKDLLVEEGRNDIALRV